MHAVSTSRWRELSSVNGEHWAEHIHLRIVGENQEVEKAAILSDFGDVGSKENE